MRNVQRLLVAATVVVAGVGITATPATACAGKICDAINLLCDKAFGGPCVR